jgi:very-short-patch-repair endonuclease
MTLEEQLRALGGVATTAALKEHGVSRHAMTVAMHRGVVTRPRKGWLALHDADPALVRAAEAGVVITCVTQAKRLGLWSRAGDVRHVAAPPHSGSVRVTRSLVHWCAPPIPRPPGILTDPIENVLAIVAECQPREEARAIWESAAHAGLVQLSAMRGYALRPAARELCAVVMPFADAGTESIVWHRLSRLPARIVPQVLILGHRVDFLIGDRLVLQIDGGHHVDAQRDEDIAHDALLRLNGYHVVRISYRQIVDDWPAVQDRILRLIAQGVHLAAA